MITLIGYDKLTIDASCSAEAITAAWRNWAGHKWIPMVIRPFQDAFTGTLPELAGVKRDAYLFGELLAMIVMAYQGKQVLAPVIGPLAQQQA
jgi:hypothetical protein